MESLHFYSVFPDVIYQFHKYFNQDKFKSLTNTFVITANTGGFAKVIIL